MKIKELHLRNIASIEKADIDFENGLNDAITGKPASIFWISGDTGAGKSALLDGISLALYKKTPRITGVVNSRNNKYKNSEGEEMMVNSIEQYTRLGIMPKDECYAEVVFEGNDAIVYHARLSLGIYQGRNTKKDTQKTRPILHKDPKWEYMKGDGAWTNVESNTGEPLLSAIGLSYDQFSRMAMLAQGQFASFLTGNKSEREAILERLTNTEIFSRYGEAIGRLFKKAKEAKDEAQVKYKTLANQQAEGPDAEQLKNEEQRLKAESENIGAELEKNRAILENLNSLETFRKELETAIRTRTQLEEETGSEEFMAKEQLIADFDATIDQRKTLADLQEADKNKHQAQGEIEGLEASFLQLVADLAFRTRQLDSGKVDLAERKSWLDQRNDRDLLYTNAGQTLEQIRQLSKIIKEYDDTQAKISDYRGLVEPLAQEVDEARQKAVDAKKAVDDKQAEMDALSKQRDNLNPQKVNDDISAENLRINQLNSLKRDSDTLAEKQKEAEDLRNNLEQKKKELPTLLEAWTKAEMAFADAKVKYDKAQELLSTMKMSLDEKLASLRRRLYEQHATTCPLCGQGIDHEHLMSDVDFQSMLSPIETERQGAKERYDKAETERSDAKTKYNTAKQTCEGLEKDLNNKNGANLKAETTLRQEAAKLGLDVEQPILPQIMEAIGQCEQRLELLRQSQNQAEELHRQINTLSQEKRPLDKAKEIAEKAYNQAETKRTKNNNDLSTSLEQAKLLQNKQDDLTQTLCPLLNPYYPDWENDLEAARTTLGADAEEYNRRKTSYKERCQQIDKEEGVVATLGQTRQSIVELQPTWRVDVEPTAYACSDINARWTSLYGTITSLTARLHSYDDVIRNSQATLDTYYAASGKNETDLLRIEGQKECIPAIRENITDNRARIKSNSDQIARDEKGIQEKLAALNVARIEDAPDKEALAGTINEKGDAFNAIMGQLGSIREKLENYRKFEADIKLAQEELEEATRKYEKWNRLNKRFGDTRFRTLVQTYILLPLLNNANIYLEQITDRYKLTCSDDNEQLAILVLDKYNKEQVRSATVLSGGERFMISLALSLALSSLNRPDMNIDILFIDEGFGTLDENSLDSVMSTLEKLQEIAGQSNRRVGIISHREELEDRIAVKIQVTKRGEGRSFVEIKNG